MTASLHATLLALVTAALRRLPAPVRRALDAWSHRVARRRALERQRAWQRRKAAAATPVPVTGEAYHLQPWRD